MLEFLAFFLLNLRCRCYWLTGYLAVLFFFSTRAAVEALRLVARVPPFFLLSIAFLLYIPLTTFVVVIVQRD